MSTLRWQTRISTSTSRSDMHLLKKDMTAKWSSAWRRMTSLDRRWIVAQSLKLLKLGLVALCADREH
jgi:hypothetical protein